MKELNFEVFLKENGVDTKLFHKNCKKKYQQWQQKTIGHTIKDLQLAQPFQWVSSAFCYESSLQKCVNWNDVHEKWCNAVHSAKVLGVKIVFGFSKKKKNK